MEKEREVFAMGRSLNVEEDLDTGELFDAEGTLHAEKTSGAERFSGEKSPGIEETFCLLDGLLGRLEGDELTLEESFETYAKGLELVRRCRQSIDKVEKKVLVLEESGELHEL